jgi:hypothetical protein
MPGQNGNLDDTEISVLLGNYSSDSGLLLLGSDFDEDGTDNEVQNLEVTVRKMSENEDLGDNDWDSRYVFSGFLSISETNNTTKTKFTPVIAISNALSCSCGDLWAVGMVKILLVFQTGPLIL